MPLFKELVKEEAIITSACLSAIYASVNYIKDKNPEPEVIDKIFKQGKTVSLLRVLWRPSLLTRKSLKKKINIKFPRRII